MKVFVIGLNGIELMPTTPRKARKLLKAGKADVAYMKPFTIRLKYKTGCACQETLNGYDTGARHIGVGTVSNGEVLQKTETKLRSSMEKKALLNKRKDYRRGRRHRKIRYRHPKFRFHTKRVYVSKGYKTKKNGLRHWEKVPVQITSPRPKGWLPPSIQSKIDHHIHLIQRYHDILPLKTKHTIEVARFDIQRMKEPNIHGEIYQKGRLYDYENTWAYVLAKYNYKCPVCGHKFDNDHKARKHHLTYRKFGATDNPDEIAPICSKCHTGENHLEGKPLDKLRKVAKSRKEYREPTFMNILRHRLFKVFPEDQFTYVNITSADRKTLGLSKTHANDAVAIAMYQCQSKKGKRLQ